MGVPISWRSKGQKGVTLSSSEAEFVAFSEVAKEVKFVFQVLQSMGVHVTLPISVRVVNTVAIFIDNNVAVLQRAKHIDVCYHFVRELSMTVSCVVFLFAQRIMIQIFSPRICLVNYITDMPPRWWRIREMALVDWQVASLHDRKGVKHIMLSCCLVSVGLSPPRTKQQDPRFIF
jgi:hypothetical protein